MKLDPRLALLKIFIIFRVYWSEFVLFFSKFFKISYNTAMIYNTKNRSNETTESQIEKKTCFNVYIKYSQSKITALNNMSSLKSVTMLQRESRTSRHAVQYK